MNAFVNDTDLRKAYGQGYDADVADTANPAAITGSDPAADRRSTDPARPASLGRRGGTQPAADPACLLRPSGGRGGGKKVRAAYVRTPPPAPAGSPTRRVDPRRRASC